MKWVSKTHQHKVKAGSGLAFEHCLDMANKIFLNSLRNKVMTYNYEKALSFVELSGFLPYPTYLKLINLIIRSIFLVLFHVPCAKKKNIYIYIYIYK